MQFVKPENTNMTFGAGDNPDTGNLDVTMAYREDIPGRVSSVSVWEPTDDELAEFIRTRKLYLSVMGAGMMPVSIMIFNPFEHYGFYPADVEDKTTLSGKLVKHITDPRAEEQFTRWMDRLREEIASREFTGNKRPLLGVAPLDAYRSLYDAGMTYMTVADKFQEWVLRGTIQDN